MAASSDERSHALVRLLYRMGAGTLGALGVKSAVRSYVLPRLIAAGQTGAAATSLVSQVLPYIRREIDRAVEGDAPILVGPWLSELGYEVLYWIPMLRWIQEEWNVPPQRMVAVSRGGMGLWYEGLCGRYIDLLDLMDPAAFVKLNTVRWEEAQGQKQPSFDRQDREVIALVRERTGFAAGSVLHPSLMFSLFWSAFNRVSPPAEVMVRTRHRPLAKPALTGELRTLLPERYVAVRFYARPSLPETPENDAFIGAMMKQLAEKHRLVVLSPGIRFDEHSDWAIENAVRIDPYMTPSNNLDIQTRVIAHAQAFVGTYGGLSYLPPLLGIPSLAFYSDDRHFHDVHLEVARTAFRDLDAELIALSTRSVVVLNELLAG